MYDPIVQAINAGIASTTADIGNVLTVNLPAVLVVFGGLVALGIILRVIRHTVGRRA